MESRWRKRYFTCSAALSVVSQAVLVVVPRLHGPSGDVVSSFDATGLLLLAYIGAAMGSVVLGALGALFWLRDGLRGDWHIDVAVASAFNALPLVYVALHEFLGTPF
jgi:hypothetical protein